MDLSSLTGLLVGLHVSASVQFGVPELAMEMREGEQFMAAAQNVLRHYSVETTQKTLDWIAFLGTTAQIYGTRFGAYMIRTRMADRPSATVYHMPQREAPKPVSPVAPAPVQTAPRPAFAEDAIIQAPEYESE